jgi:alpha-ketoglutarate-dependent taurine dioxygenase
MCQLTPLTPRGTGAEVHRDNGRRYLYLNPVRMGSISACPRRGAGLIGELMAHATRSKYEYRHQWQRGDMVIWDNRSVMHQANADYDMRETRRLYRIMIKGELHPSDLAAREGVQLDVAQRLPA